MRAARLVIVPLLLSLCGYAAVQAQQGKAIFEGKGNCHTCHGKNARGTPLAPNLTDTEWLNGDGSLASIRGVIESGVAQPKKHPAPMPPMGGAKLSKAEIDAVAGYVFGLSRGSDDATAATRIESPAACRPEGRMIARPARPAGAPAAAAR